METKQRSDMKIAVLAGGISDERNISLESGKNARAALEAAGYGTVDLIDTAAPGFLTDLANGSYDVAFLALHGKGGEDGTMQGALELLGIPYTGSDSIASACAVDKDLAKLLYARAGIPVAAGVALLRSDSPDIDAIVETVGRQSFVKPAVNGSSFGVKLVKDPSELADAIAFSHEYGDKILVEERLVGTEVTVGVIGDGETLRALPVVEIRMPKSADFYDLDVKYVDPTDIHRIPAEIPQDVYEQVQEYACAAHRALGCYGISRTDFIVTGRGPVALETNTIPGMTSTSLFPDEIRHAGATFEDACAELVDLALKRAAR